MHTVIRHTKTENGFAVVITGFAAATKAAVVQEYKQTERMGASTILIAEHYYSDERTAIKFFDSVWFAQEAGT